MLLSSNDYSTIKDNNETFYELEKFKYYTEDKVLKGQNVNVTTNITKEKSDNFYFKRVLLALKIKLFLQEKQKFCFTKIFDKERKKFIDLENAKLNELFEDYYRKIIPDYMACHLREMKAKLLLIKEYSQVAKKLKVVQPGV